MKVATRPKLTNREGAKDILLEYTYQLGADREGCYEMTDEEGLLRAGLRRCATCW